MKTFFKILLGFSVLLVLTAWLVGSFLSPDDISQCGAVPTTAKGCGRADAIVAISGGDTLARTNEAIKLYKNGWADTLIFSGAAADKSGPSNAEVMRDQAVEEGVDVNAIIIEEDSQTTNENAVKTADIFTRNNIKSAIIVTSAYHERRATLEFQRQSNTVALRSHPVAHDKQWSEWWWLTPTGWALAIPELVTSLVLSTGGIER